MQTLAPLEERARSRARHRILAALLRDVDKKLIAIQSPCLNSFFYRTFRVLTRIMKASTLVLGALAAILIPVQGHTIHIDVTPNGDVGIDLDSDGPRDLHHPQKHVVNSHIPSTADDLKDYQLEFAHGIHQGFLSVSDTNPLNDSCF